MVCRCVAVGCSLTHKDGISPFGFPKGPLLRKKWAEQVRRTEDKWKCTQHSVVCSKHFEDWCIEAESKLLEAMGQSKKAMFKGQCWTNSVWEGGVVEEKGACNGISATNGLTKTWEIEGKLALYVSKSLALGCCSLVNINAVTEHWCCNECHHQPEW